MISRADFEETLGFRPPPWERRWSLPNAEPTEAETGSLETRPQRDGMERQDQALSARWARVFGLTPPAPTLEAPDAPSVVLRRRLQLPLEGVARR